MLSLVWEGNASLKWDKLILERLRIGEKAARLPELFPPGTAEYFRRECPVSLYRLGVLDLNAGATKSARARFRASLHEQWRFTTALGYAATLLPGFLRRGLLAVKRAAGLRWAIRVD